MTAAQTRATVLAYQRIRELLPFHQYPEEVQDHMNAFLCHVENLCQEATSNSEPGRWARSVVGPVLAAGLGATGYMRETVPNEATVLRIFGLIGDRSLSTKEAWLFVQRYAFEPVLSPEILAEVQRTSRVRLTKLPKNPNALDLLEELTRPRTDSFRIQLSRWVAEHFRLVGPTSDDIYGAEFRRLLQDLEGVNTRGELAPVAGVNVAHGRRFTREEWAALLAGRIPQARLEERASYMVTRKFLIDYWKAWQKKVDRLKPFDSNTLACG